MAERRGVLPYVMGVSLREFGRRLGEALMNDADANLAAARSVVPRPRPTTWMEANPAYQQFPDHAAAVAYAQRVLPAQVREHGGREAGFVAPVNPRDGSVTPQTRRLGDAAGLFSNASVDLSEGVGDRYHAHPAPFTANGKALMDTLGRDIETYVRRSDGDTVSVVVDPTERAIVFGSAAAMQRRGYPVVSRDDARRTRYTPHPLQESPYVDRVVAPGAARLQLPATNRIYYREIPPPGH